MENRAKKAIRGESAEEFTQEITEYGFGKLAGQERRERTAKEHWRGCMVERWWVQADYYVESIKALKKPAEVLPIKQLKSY